MKEITDMGFKYDLETEIVSCAECEGSSGSGEFFYASEDGLEFDQDVFFPKEFSNLKRTVSRHIQSSKSHINALKTQAQKEKDEKEVKTAESSQSTLTSLKPSLI